MIMDLKNTLKKFLIIAKLNFSTRQPFKLKSYIKIALVILIISLPSFYFYQKYQRTQSLLANPDKLGEIQLNALLKKVTSIIELPENERPELRTVVDVGKVKTNPFFEKAQNGDKLLIYVVSKKAFLYRPSTNKIINVGPITTSSATSPASDSGRIKTGAPPQIILTPTISL